ncbi:MAG: GNAT family N-acetyltransferase [Legionellales bacterium]|nr:GNAT family N-acetyltransferase [Legionellales bacterium]
MRLCDGCAGRKLESADVKERGDTSSWSKLSPHEHLCHFSLYIDKIPVASLTLSIANGLARIDDVGTLPAYQRRGYATDLIRHALTLAYRLGITHCFLEASLSGQVVYEKIGFNTLFTSEIYVKT